MIICSLLLLTRGISHFTAQFTSKASSRLVMSEDQVPDIVLPIKKARSIQSISYDQVEQMIYWVDHGRDQQPARQVIRRSSDLGDTQVLNRLDKFLPFDLTIDPVTR